MADLQDQRPKSTGAVQDLTGTTVGRFVVRARLGGGGMGEVYRAEDTVLKRIVALKRISPRLQADEQYRRRFLKEAQRASRLSDPRIASVYDVFEDNREIFLVMEYVEGETLRQRLGKPFSPDQFQEVATQCAEALATAHEKGIIHRDIKPENIMLTPKGQVKILDFGVARELPRSTETSFTASFVTEGSGLKGTPAYMSPEALLEKEADERADLFSLGVVFYEMLTGKHPFYAGSFMATSDRILHSTPPAPSQSNPQVSPRLDLLITRLLAKDIAERYATAAELLADLRQFQHPTPALELRPEPRPLPPRRVRRVLGWLVLTVLVLLMAAVTWRVTRPTLPRTRIRVAVMPYENQTGDARLDQFRLTLTQILLLNLTGSPNIQVLPYERLLEITRGFEAERKELFSSEAIRTVASYSNAQFIVVPAMFALGKSLRVSAEFRDAQTGETVGAAKVDREVSGSVEETIYRMQDQLADAIQAYFKKVGGGEARWPRSGVSRPKTVTAGFDFTEGRNALAQGNYAQALKSFERVVQEDPQYALAYARMGQIYGMLGYDDKARAFSENAARFIRPEMPVIDADFIQANLAERKYDYPAAVERYLELSRLYPDDPASYADLAAVYEKQGRYQEAIAGLKQTIARDANYIVAYQRLGYLYASTRDFSQALSYGQKALELYRALGNREGEANASVDLGEVFRLKGDFSQARQSGQSALKIFQSLGNEFGTLRATMVLGNILFSEGKLQEARKLYQQIVSTSGEIRNNRLVAQALMNIGVTYSQEGDLTKAVEYYQRGADTPALRQRAEALTNLGGLLIEYGPDPERGLKDIQEALPIFRTMGDKLWEAHDRMSIGLYNTNAARYTQASDEFPKAEALFRAIDYKRGVTQSKYILGRCYFFQNQYERALDSVGEALAIAQTTRDPFRVSMSQILLGWIYTRLGDFAQGQPLLEAGLQAAQKSRYGELLPDACDALGEFYAAKGDRKRARDSFQQGAALWREPNVSESTIEARSNLGVLEAGEGNFERGLSDCTASVAKARKLMHVHTLARALLNLATVYLQRKDYAKTLETLGELASPDKQELGLELRARTFFIEGRALAGLGKKDAAKGSYQRAQQAIRQFEETLSPNHRESFSARPEIREVLSWNKSL